MTAENNGWLSEASIKLKRGNKVLFAKESILLADLNERLAYESHKTIVLWAFELASGAVGILKERYPSETRPQAALELSRSWAAGDVKMPMAKKAILGCHAFAKEILPPEDAALCHAVGQACGVVHTIGHAIGFPIYELTALAISLGIDNCKEAIEARVKFYIERLDYWRGQSSSFRVKWAAFME